jgi:hypothetical protein
MLCCGLIMNFVSLSRSKELSSSFFGFYRDLCPFWLAPVAFSFLTSGLPRLVSVNRFSQFFTRPPLSSVVACIPAVISVALGPNVAASSPVMIVFLNINAATPAARIAAASSPKIVARIMSGQFCPLSPFSSCCFYLIW